MRTRHFQWALGAFGGGAGLVLGVAGIKALMTRPEFLPQLLSGGFLGFAALIFGMVVMDRKADRFLAVHERNVVAQELLAQSVGQLVAKDDQRAREQELTLNHLARQSDEILRRLPPASGANLQ